MRMRCVDSISFPHIPYTLYRYTVLVRYVAWSSPRPVIYLRIATDFSQPRLPARVYQYLL